MPEICVIRYDYLKIADENSTTVGVYCGEQTGRTVDVTGSHIVVEFQSDFSWEERGYAIIFTAVSLCKSNLNAGRCF